MNELITRTKTIKEAIDQIVSYAKELAQILVEEQVLEQLVSTKEGLYLVTVLTDTNGEVDTEIKNL